MKKLFILLLSLLSLSLMPAFAKEWRVITELDVLPYATGGYYFSGGLVKDHIRIRAVRSVVNIPEFSSPDGFDNYRNRAIALIADYCPGKGGYNKGFWIGSGVEYWDNTIRNKQDHETTRFSQYILTAGAGYIIPVGNHFFINPWAAIHLDPAGKKTYQIGNREAEIASFFSEGSLKLGWRF